MASYSPKLLEKKYNNWVKAQLAVLFTKEGLEPFVCNEVQQFQLRCLNDICYNNGLNSGTICSSCCTENLVKCPTDRICNSGRGKCRYHRNASTKYLPSGCPNKICDHFKTKIQNVHRHYGPSYKNTDATNWCSISWEVAKCFMPPDGYKDVTCSADTDFNGVISVIINNKDFQQKIQENLSSKNNIFEQARVIGRTVRHSSSLEVEDTDLQQYFRVLQTLLSDPVYLATDTCAQNAKQKLTDLEKDTVVISTDEFTKALTDTAKAAQDTIRSEKDKQKKQSEKNRQDLIKTKQKHLKELETATDKRMKTLKNKGRAERQKLVTIGKRKREQIEKEGDIQIKRIKEQKTEDKEQTYMSNRKKLQDQLIIWYRRNHSTVPLSPLTEGRDTPLANFYVKPDIDMNISYFSERKETTRLKTLNDLFGSGRNVQQEIYLSADAGFGKTAFSKYLTMLWCQSHFKDENYDCFKEEEISALSDFDFVFLVPLRDSSSFCHVDEIIQTQLNENLQCSVSLPKKFVSEILNDEKCLVILDGLDEWSHPQNSCTRPIKCIPHRYARKENCVILTTTRPWKLGNSDIKTSQIDKIVELVELNNKSVQELEMNALREMKKGLPREEWESQQQQLNKAIDDHDLKDLKAVPLILLYIIALWCDGKPITESKSRLYASIIELLLSRTLKKYSALDTAPDPSQYKLPQCFSDHGKCQKYSTLIVALGKLAFHTLFSEKKENSLVFDKSVAAQYLGQEQLKLCLLSGILTENKVMKFSEDISRISFSHKTVQEYFTAVYNSCQPILEAVKTITEKCQSLQDILDLKIFLVFISGMNPEIMSSLSHDLMSVINSDDISFTYRAMTKYDDMYINPLHDIQTMLTSCMKQCKRHEDVKLCLQDVFITEKCQQGNYLNIIQDLFIIINTM